MDGYFAELDSYEDRAEFEDWLDSQTTLADDTPEWPDDMSGEEDDTPEWPDDMSGEEEFA